SWPDMPRWMMSTSPPSRRARRYLPRRSTPVIFLPSRRVMNCLRLWWRRTLRIPSTSTPLTRLPTISRSRSRRTTSTSGNSGIGPFLGVVQVLPGGPGGRLLCLLLGAALAFAAGLAVEAHRGEEPLRMVGAFGPDLVAGQLVEATRRQLLQPGLVVL